MYARRGQGTSNRTAFLLHLSPVPPAPFELSSEQLGGVLVVRVRGEIDTATAPAMWEAVEDALREKRRVVLDLGGVEFIDLHGLAVLKRASRRAPGEDGFAIARPAPCVLRLLELVRERGIPILPDGPQRPEAA